ncbi:MAG: hypothetical protein A3E84_04630 [Gammaproteobacteria bacterium RIFCSPHIGHO2_12_FULL_42_13]|nr:MAG: hypothetical protein A3E84_04630 [Gammaproteobacteria bacterium RIFCSPHIGHO2_12_FULL_42_13]
MITLFPLEKYNQTLSAWIHPESDDFNTPLMSAETQQARTQLFYEHYCGKYSPWDSAFVNQLLTGELKSIETEVMNAFDNTGKPDEKIGYAEDFRPYQKAWIAAIAENINLEQFDSVYYRAENRAITVDNLHARVLPTDDPYFYSHTIPGEGYPFDNLQMSALWAGTPVYVIGETRDHLWMLVITSDYIAWVKSAGVAYTDNHFVSEWKRSAQAQLVAISKTQTSVLDNNNHALFSAYVGAVFPGVATSSGFEINIPVKNKKQLARIKKSAVSSENAVLMPLSATPHNFSTMMNTLIGRPYGWGGMYFYNDCSAELKNLFTPFGIWLPRHSSNQVTVSKMDDLSASSPEERLAYLIQHGKKFLTIVYIGGHVVMYVGHDDATVMSYQNIWGLAPNPSTKRVVIGQAVLFPLLLQYPEDPGLVSLAAKKYFQIAYLDQLPESDKLYQGNVVNIRNWMFPEKSEW